MSTLKMQCFQIIIIHTSSPSMCMFTIAGPYCYLELCHKYVAIAFKIDLQTN